MFNHTFTLILLKMLRCLFAVCISLANQTQAHSSGLNLINKLNNFYCFDHNLMLMESTSIADQFINTPVSAIELNSYVPQTLYVINDISGEIKINPIRRSKNTFMIIGLKSTNLEKNIIFMTKIKDFQRVNVNLKIGLFFSQSLPTSDYLLQLFEWCWQNSIVHIFIGYPETTGRTDYFLNVYTFNPYGTLELINLTDDDSLDNYFPRICYNLRQHPIRIAVHDDINTFIYSKGNPNFGGPDGKLFQTILRLINASYTMVKFFEITDGMDIQQMALNGTIDLGPQPFRVSNVKPIYLYPIYIDTVAIVVPSALPYAEFIAYLQTFSNDNIFNISLFSIPVLIIALTVFRYLKRNRFLFFQSVSDVLNLFMYDNTAIDYRNLFRVESFIILPLTMGGFVIINVVLSILTSYLTRPMVQPEINTFDDIERSPFPVMVPSQKNMEQLIVVFKKNWNIDWSHKMAWSSLEEFLHQILSFNTSICFVYRGSKVKNLLVHQKRLNIRGFRIPTQTIIKSVYSYVVPVDYPLKDCFNEIIQRVMSAGLYWKWTDESYFEFIEKGYFSKTLVNDDAERGAEKYYVPIFIVYGWIGSVFIFMIEIAWNRIHVKQCCRKVKRVKN